MVTLGYTTGLATVEVNPAGDDVQLKVDPGTADVPNWVPVFRQMLLSAPETAAGNEPKFTVTGWVLVQPVAVMVSTRV